MKTNTSALLITITFVLFSLIPSQAQTQKTSYSSNEILVQLQQLNTVGTVMYIAAHPDDENTRMISWLCKEKKVRTVYLSMTRGSGGQNLIGTEKGEDLGLLRTQELLNARSIDGGEQQFTRAVDFGYSKNPEETFAIWNKNNILADVVYAIRQVRPDVIITRFPTTGEGGHGHHTASAMLASEAFLLAADPKAFPEQLKTVEIWQAKRVLWNSFSWNRKNNEVFPGEIPVETGGYNTLLGKNYGEIAAEARSQHRCQGFGSRLQRGSNIEYVKNILGDSIKTDVLENIDLSWNRVKNGASISKDLSAIIAAFNPLYPEKSIEALLKVREKIAQLNDKQVLNYKLKQVDAILFSAAGIYTDATTTLQNIGPGNTLALNLEVINRSKAQVILESISIENLKDTVLNFKLAENQFFQENTLVNIPKDFAISQPNWLWKEKSLGNYMLNDELAVNMAENNTALSVVYKIRINGTLLTKIQGVRYKTINPSIGELYEPLVVAPPVVFELSKNALVFNSGKEKSYRFSVKNYGGKGKTQIHINCPENWKTSWTDSTLNFEKSGEIIALAVSISPEKTSSNKPVSLGFSANYDGKDYAYQRVDIKYDHIKQQTWFPPAVVQLSSLDGYIPSGKIAYIIGSGDDVASSLRQVGYTVDELNASDLRTANLSQYKAILCGIRAYNVNEELGSFNNKLHAYIKDGGNYIVQYQTSNFIATLKTSLAPSDFTVGRDRVTDENAEITILEPSKPIFNTPNKISGIDFENWVQERGLYFASKWSSDFTPLLALNDAGEEQLKGALLQQKYGKGNFFYTGISFFRQLPAGVPGAYRLLINLIENKQ